MVEWRFPSPPTCGGQWLRSSSLCFAQVSRVCRPSSDLSSAQASSWRWWRGAPASYCWWSASLGGLSFSMDVFAVVALSSQSIVRDSVLHWICTGWSCHCCGILPGACRRLESDGVHCVGNAIVRSLEVTSPGFSLPSTRLQRNSFAKESTTSTLVY